MATTIVTAAEYTLVSAGASCVSGAALVSGAINNAPNQGGYPWGRLGFTGAFGAVPTAGTALQIWLVMSIDGTNGSAYENNNAVGPIFPPRPADFIILMDGVSTSYAATKDWAPIPQGYLKVMIYNAGTAQTLSAGWYLTVIPETLQS